MKKPLSEYRPSIQRSYLFINDFISERGFGPTIREIKSDGNLSSTSVAVYHRDQLIKGGLITYDPGRDRSIALAGAITLTFFGIDADYIRDKFGHISGAELVRELRNEEAVASWGQNRS